MPPQLHHVVMRSHSAQTFVAFLTDVVGMEVQFQMRVPGEILEKTLGWPPSDGADVTMLGTGDAGLVEVLDVPPHLREIAPEGLAALSFLTDDFGGVREKATSFADDVTALDTGIPGVDLFFCTLGGVPWSSWAPMRQKRTPAPVRPRTPESDGVIRCGLARVGFQRQDSHGEIGDSDDVAVATSISSSTQVYYR